MRSLIGPAISLSMVLLAEAGIACDLPAAVPDRVGRAQTFTYNMKRSEYEAYQSKRDFIWSDTGPTGSRATPRFLTHVYSSIYTALRRVPSKGYGPNYNTVPGWSLSWLAEHHPDWIVYKCDRKTPSFEFNDATFIPVDISNPEVRQWRLENEIRPLLSAGYKGISVDNIEAGNPFQYCGTFSGPNATWEQRYTGARYGDEIFVQDQITWLTELKAYVNGINRGCVSGNIAFQPKVIEATRRLTSAVDIVFDEGGFNGGVPSCEAGGGSRYGLYGQTWLTKFQFFSNLRKSFVLGSNGLCNKKSESRVATDWVLASYLLVKNSHSYVGWFERDFAALEDVSDFYLLHGPAAGPAELSPSGIVMRRFQKVIALINPGISNAATVDLDGKRYRDLSGAMYHNSVVLKPRQAKVLIRTE